MDDTRDIGWTSGTMWAEYLFHYYSDAAMQKQGATRAEAVAARAAIWARLLISDHPLGDAGRHLIRALHVEFRDWKTNRIVGEHGCYTFPYLAFIKHLEPIDSEDKNFRLVQILRAVDCCNGQWGKEMLDQDTKLHTALCRAWEEYAYRKAAQERLRIS